ncbi:MAG: outer membrane lipoprotein chaperone LolA [Plesiomonas sp.]|uniref:outer membrane lipoprotein chaperone LolA n=1 Tax=Plesiomonas sp. TaxID=2486279 RepID=UPI003F36FF27
MKAQTNRKTASIKTVIAAGVMVCGLALSLISSSAWADARSDLQTRLSKVNSFSASFTQMVKAANGTTLQKGNGVLSVSRPNLFRWESKTPDETLLVTDGKTVWFFNPFVEQVTISNLKDVTGNTPFVLLTRNNPSDWAQYNVSQKGDLFTLKPIKNSGNIKQFQLNVTSVGIINGFSVVEQDGQTSKTTLSNLSTTSVNKATYTFNVPKGVEIDDQRQ